MWVGFFFTCLKSDQQTGKAAGIRLERIDVAELPEMLGVIVGQRKGEGSKPKLKFPLLAVEHGFELDFLERECFPLLVFSFTALKKTVKASTTALKIAHDWYRSIEMDEGCDALWVYPGGYLPRPWL